MKNLGLLIANRVRLERDGWLHRGQADELHDVIWNHVPESAGLIVIATPFLHSDRFRN